MPDSKHSVIKCICEDPANCGAQDGVHVGCPLEVENAKLKAEAANWKALCQERGPIVPILREIEEVKADRDRLKGLVEKALRLLPGWRELIAEWDDHGKDEALGQAMWAALDQIDTWRKEARAEAKGGGK